MPRYFFHVHTDIEVRDGEGIDLPDLNAAKALAVRSARALATEDMRSQNRFSPNHSIAIADAAGQLLYSVRYGDCIDVRL